MKRQRSEAAAEMAATSEIRSAIEELSLMAVNCGGDVQKQTSGRVPLKPFLSICNLLIQVLDKIGPTMAVLRQDMHQNIERLERFHDSDPSAYCDVVEILKKEVSEGRAKKGPTCSKSFVWLTRSLDFSLSLVQLLLVDLGRNMDEAVEESYTATLKPWHGWISSAAYKVALKLLPDSQTLVNILKVKDQDHEKLKEEMQSLIALLTPVLEQNKEILKIYGLDKLKST
ncbi:glycolipid transfer protein 3-like [Andrographis paniculata]|uniref:glycolipid transfer protein 3-like n=1 Tax=Andrographis paniculata TaxID=175694 RepID=UPI0021E991DA|nr:glycolipid transfer protein 3-like [Andrographis paniculata]